VEQPSFVSLAMNFALGGVVVSLLLLSGEYYVGSRRTSLAALALSAILLLAAAGLHAASFAAELTIPLAALAAMALAGAMLRSSAIRQALGHVAQPACWWCLGLATSVAAAVYVLGYANPRPKMDDLPMHQASAYHMLPESVAVTDAGRELPLCAYDESDDGLLDQELSIINLVQYSHQIIRIAEPSARSNCHGWVYFGGQYAVRSRDVDTILADNGYAPVEQPAPGDVATYRGSSDEITHSALVRLVREDGAVIVESKWGPLGVYLHPVEIQPYGLRRTYYHSDRSGHLVRVLPTTSRSADESPLASTESHDDPSPLLSALRASSTRRNPYDRPTLRIPGQRKS
jgi:hypothetical protein